MPSVSFGTLWLNPASDLTAGMSFPLNSLERDPLMQVSSRLYAGGNYRMITTPGRQQTAKVTLGFCTDAQTAFLEANQGVLVCFRDPRSGKFFGFYEAPTFTPRFIAGSWSVPFTVQQVTWSELA